MSQNSQHAIQLDHLTKSYSNQQAVKPLDLSISKGELFGFLGPNGAGKTTTIKMMTGLLEPTAGTVSIGGIDMWQQPIAAKRQIAYIPDTPNLYDKLTGREFLRFVASVFQVPEEVFQKRAEKYLNLFHLDHRADDLIEGYSHGMKQKIAITGGLIHEPDVIFLDEPTVGLDPESARVLKQLLRHLCDQGTTVFLSTHILEIAEAMCDRVGIIKDGDLIALGTMAELREKGSGAEASLEDIFLELTGGQAEADMLKSLKDEDERR